MKDDVNTLKNLENYFGDIQNKKTQIIRKLRDIKNKPIGCGNKIVATTELDEIIELVNSI